MNRRLPVHFFTKISYFVILFIINIWQNFGTFCRRVFLQKIRPNLIATFCKDLRSIGFRSKTITNIFRELNETITLCKHTEWYTWFKVCLGNWNKLYQMGSGCGSVVGAVASNAWGLWFKSNHRQKKLTNIFTANCWKDKNKENEVGMAH